MRSTKPVCHCHFQVNMSCFGREQPTTSSSSERNSDINNVAYMEEEYGRARLVKVNGHSCTKIVTNDVKDHFVLCSHKSGVTTHFSSWFSPWQHLWHVVQWTPWAAGEWVLSMSWTWNCPHAPFLQPRPVPEGAYPSIYAAS